MSLFQNMQQQQPQYQPMPPQYQPTTKELIITRGKKFAKYLGFLYIIGYIVMSLILVVSAGELFGIRATLCLALSYFVLLAFYMIVIAVGSIFIKD